MANETTFKRPLPTIGVDKYTFFSVNGGHSGCNDIRYSGIFAGYC